ncbi:HAD hydrolase-like protein [Paenibacillus sp. JX-17]|uniref:HAD hydrolase-like protein n=2 Tax=Paenibacillus lacisoli TaxID=3064525 RepID=A0ABT9CBQ4_9BACL|nr:HAD hydrolase-like protein [Paenibacillus sp. JX-17]
MTDPASAKWIVFDIDGTLTSSVNVHQEAFYRALQAYGFTNINTDWGSYKHFSDSWIFKENYQLRYGTDNSPSELIQFEQAFDEAYRNVIGTNQAEVVPGARECLEELERHRVPFCFATGSMRSAAIHKLGAFGKSRYLSVLATASEGYTREEIIRYAMKLAAEHNGKSPDSFSRVVSVGDGLWDLRTAQGLRYEFLGIASGDQAGRLRQEGAVHIIRDFTDPAWKALLL